MSVLAALPVEQTKRICTFFSVKHDGHCHALFMCNSRQFFRKFSKVQNCKIFCPYLISTWKMHQNEYKQAYVRSSGSWNRLWYFYQLDILFLLRPVVSVETIMTNNNMFYPLYLESPARWVLHSRGLLDEEFILDQIASVSCQVYKRKNVIASPKHGKRQDNIKAMLFIYALLHVLQEKSFFSSSLHIVFLTKPLNEIKPT